VLLTLGLALAAEARDAVEPAAGPAPVPGFKPPESNEHPRLFFRKWEIPALRKRAETPEGRAIVERMKFLLGSTDQCPRKSIDRHHGRKVLDSWTLGHAMGYGLLYHLTGEKKYIALSKEAMDIAYSGQCDEPKRDYSWKRPASYLRGGPSVAMVAMGYDMCYDLWEPAYREKVARDILNYDARVTMKQMVQGGNHGPKSNHHGSALGGAGLCMLAIAGDTGVDKELHAEYLRTIEQRIQTLFQQGMGDSGTFWEGTGPGQIASDTCFVPMLQAFRVAAGKDYAAGMPGPRALVMRWTSWLMPNPENGQPIFGYTEASWGMGGYGGRTFSRYGLSRGGQFSQGFGLLTDSDEKAATLWVYKNAVEPSEQKDYADYQLGGKPSYDAINLPHRAALALVNWPIGIAPKNPEGIVAKTGGDTTQMGYCWFRQGWKDANDIFVGVLCGSRAQMGGSGRPEDILVWGLGERHVFFWKRTGAPDFYEGYADGSGVVTHDENAVAVDFSGASGSDAVVVVAGPAASTFETTRKGEKSKYSTVQFAGRPAGVLVLSSSGKFPEVAADGDRLVIGGQTVTFDGKRLALAKNAGPWKPAAQK